MNRIKSISWRWRRSHLTYTTAAPLLRSTGRECCTGRIPLIKHRALAGDDNRQHKWQSERLRVCSHLVPGYWYPSTIRRWALIWTHLFLSTRARIRERYRCPRPCARALKWAPGPVCTCFPLVPRSFTNSQLLRSYCKNGVCWRSKVDERKLGYPECGQSTILYRTRELVPLSVNTPWKSRLRQTVNVRLKFRIPHNGK